MRRLLLVLMLGLSASSAYAAIKRQPESWSLSHLPQANLREMERSPAFRVEMMIALTVATERCISPDYPILERTRPTSFLLRGDPERSAFGGPLKIEAIGSDMGFEYRRAYGDAWWGVLSTELHQTRAKYESHPDPGAFCKLAETAARQAFLAQGRDQIARLARSYRQLTPANALTGAASTRKPARPAP
jgi:hypothetical protein